jgi:hypothetical protein
VCAFAAVTMISVGQVSGIIAATIFLGVFLSSDAIFLLILGLTIIPQLNTLSLSQLSLSWWVTSRMKILLPLGLSQSSNRLVLTKQLIQTSYRLGPL